MKCLISRDTQYSYFNLKQFPLNQSYGLIEDDLLCNPLQSQLQASYATNLLDTINFLFES